MQSNWHYKVAEVQRDAFRSAASAKCPWIVAVS